jgi:hypothetical protein
VADVPSGLSLTPPQETLKKTKILVINRNIFETGKEIISFRGNLLNIVTS